MNDDLAKWLIYVSENLHNLRRSNGISKEDYLFFLKGWYLGDFRKELEAWRKKQLKGST